MPQVNIILNGKPVVAEAGQTILEAAEANGIAIPTLCHNAELKPFGSCWICVVRVKGARSLVPACSSKVAEGMEITTDEADIHATRKMCLELLMSDHLGDCLAPCRVTCPAGCNIPEFISSIALGDDRAAIEVIKRNIMLPASLGRICPRPCEEECRRNRMEGAVAICWLKRFAADQDLASARPYVPERAPATGKKVAVVGAGPAGLAAAYYLLLQGHAVTVFEAHPKPGGMLRYGIPEFRLPRNVLDAEVDYVVSLGAEMRYGTKLGRDVTLEGLRAAGYDAIFMGIGAQLASSMRIEGEDTPGVLSGVEFLGDVSAGRPQKVGDRVVVVGGGNTAVDAARTSLRLGASGVSILYRRTRKEMPANEVEIEEALKEGVRIEFLAAPIRAEPAPAGKVKLTCIRMELGEPDASGRRSPVPIKGSEHQIVCDTVIAAIGQAVDTSALQATGIETDRGRSIKVNPRTLETNVPGVFAGGDCVTGADIAVRAIGAGRLAATSISQYLRGEEVTGEPELFRMTMGALDKVPGELFEERPRRERARMPEREVEVRRSTFDEVEVGFSDPQARDEATRCLTCGCAKAEDCKVRTLATQYGCDPERFAGERRHIDIDDSHPYLVYEANKCIMCGTCVRACEELLHTSALGFVGRGFTARIRPPFAKKLAQTLHRDGWQKLAEMCPTGALSQRKKAKAAV